MRIEETTSSMELVYIMNYFSNPGFTKIGADLIAFLIPTKAYLTSSVQEKKWSFLRRLWIGLTIVTKYGTNLRMKLITPIKSWTSFLEVGAGRLRIVAILSGSMLIPESETMCPRIFLSVMPKMDLEGFREMPNFLHHMRTFLRWPKWSDWVLE